jgi:hypothetical protein
VRAIGGAHATSLTASRRWWGRTAWRYGCRGPPGRSKRGAARSPPWPPVDGAAAAAYPQPAGLAVSHGRGRAGGRGGPVPGGGLRGGDGRGRLPSGWTCSGAYNASAVAARLLGRCGRRRSVPGSAARRGPGEYGALVGDAGGAFVAVAGADGSVYLRVWRAAAARAHGAALALNLNTVEGSSGVASVVDPRAGSGGRRHQGRVGHAVARARRPGGRRRRVGGARGGLCAGRARRGLGRVRLQPGVGRRGRRAQLGGRGVGTWTLDWLAAAGGSVPVLRRGGPAACPTAPRQTITESPPSACVGGGGGCARGGGWCVCLCVFVCVCVCVCVWWWWGGGRRVARSLGYELGAALRCTHASLPVSPYLQPYVRRIRCKRHYAVYGLDKRFYL